MDAPHTTMMDERIDMAHWFPMVEPLDVPTPETYKVELQQDGDGMPTFDMDRAVEIVTEFGGEAFIRSGYKSAALNSSESVIRSSEPERINTQVSELLSQHVMMQLPTGGNVWFRELLDVNFCAYARENLAPEIRVFIRDNEVVCYHPRLEGFEKYPQHKETAIDFIESAWEREYAEYETEYDKRESVKTYAERVADAVDGWWSVDFVMDKNGKCWLIDMALDGVYDAEERNGEGLRHISEHPGDCEHQIV